MDPRWHHVEEIFNAAVELPHAERAALLDQACGGDENLRSEVESLLAHDDPRDRFMEAALAVARSDEGEPSNVATDTVLTPTRGRPLQIGPYRIVREIGSGGMGVLYEAIREDHFQKKSRS